MSAQALAIANGENGVLKILNGPDKSYYVADEVMILLNISKPTAYKLMRSLRLDMIAEGKLNKAYPVGRIPKWYFDKNCGIKVPEESEM